MAVTDPERWPSIRVADWQDTRDTLQLYTQVVGKVRMVNEPHVNHWWNVPLYVSATGLTTSLMPHPTGPASRRRVLRSNDVVAHRPRCRHEHLADAGGDPRRDRVSGRPGPLPL